MSVRKGGRVIAGVAKGDKFPAGIIAPFAGTAIPAGWLLCDGSAISRTDYADLFNAIGTTYGDGDGSSTFNLPNLNYTFPLWRNDESNIGSYWIGQAPNITGQINYIYALNNASSTGALYVSNNSSQNNWSNLTTNRGWRLNINASLSSSIYQDGANSVIPPNIKMYWVIKY